MSSVPMGQNWARAMLASPTTTPQDLAAIAAAYPALAPEVAVHPNLYPDLEAWLRGLKDPAVNAALAARHGAARFAPQGATGGSGGQSQAAAPDALEEAPEPHPKRPWLAPALVIAVALVVLAGAGTAAWFAVLKPQAGGTTQAPSGPSATDTTPGTTPSTTTSPSPAKPSPTPTPYQDTLGNDDVPSWMDAPVVGDPIDIAEALGGGFTEAHVIAYTDATHALVYAQGDAWEAESDNSVKSATIGLIDFATGRATWQVDLAQPAGLDRAFVGCGENVGHGLPIADVQGNVLVTVSPAVDYSGLSHVLLCTTVLLDNHGQTVTVQQGMGDLLAWDGQVAAFTNDWNLRAYTTPDMTLAWTQMAAAMWNYYLPNTQLGLPDGSIAVPSDDGYVNLATGEVLPFGKDLDYYITYVTAGSALLQITSDRYSTTYDVDIMRLDPATGWDLWDDELSATDVVGAVGPVGSEVLVLLASNGAELRGVNLTDGSEVWTQTIRIGATATVVDPNTIAVVGLRSGQPITLFDGATGQTVWSFNSPSDGASVVLGHDVMFVTTADSLHGYSVASPGTELWQVDLPKSTRNSLAFLDGGQAVEATNASTQDYTAYTLTQIIPLVEAN